MSHLPPGSITRRTLLRNGALVASGCFCAPWPLSASPALADPDPSAQSWTIGNDFIQRVLTFESGVGLYTRHFAALSPQIEFIAPGQAPRSSEFSFLCNGQSCSGTNGVFELLSAAASDLRNGKSLTIRLRHKELGFETHAVYSVYDGHPALRKHVVVRNTGSSTLHLSHMQIESLAVSLGPANEITLLTQYGAVPREIFYTGRSEDAGLLVANGLTGIGLAIISEIPGYMKRTEIGGWHAPDHLRLGVMYDTDLMPFERALSSGEQFTTASSSLVAFRNRDAASDPHWVIPSYTAEVLERRVNTQGPPWIYNTWEPFERGIDRDTTLELIDAAGAMGIDVFTIDDGWQQEYGENAVNLAAFPGGLDPILQAVESRGMRLGLWIPLAAIGESTQVYRDHPEWAARDRDGNMKTTGTMAGLKAVMCMASAFRETAADRIIDAIDRFRLAYVKLDLTTIFNAYGEAPGCYAKGHDHGNWAESLNRIYEGIAWVTAKVYQKHPEVLLDLTFELWGQKHIIDAGLLAAGDLDWMSNVDDREPNSAGPIQARQLLYSRAATMPVESMLIGNIHAELPTIQESFATAIGSAPLLLGDLRKLTSADRAWYHEKIGWFKNLRKTTPISQSFFPLGSWQQTTPAAWDGFARLARTGNGLIALFRNKSRGAEAQVALPLLPSGRYQLRSVMAGKEIGVFSSADLARGIPVPFTGPVEVLELRASKA